MCVLPVAGLQRSPLCAFYGMCSVQTLWHSSAHVLGQALEQLYGVDLTVGPVIEEGFYYDCYMGEGRGTLSNDEWQTICSKMESIAKEGQQFQRVEVTREEAKDMFKENRFKVRVLALRSARVISIHGTVLLGIAFLCFPSPVGLNTPMQHVASEGTSPF